MRLFTPAQEEADPVIAPGVPGADETATATDTGVLEPQLLFAVTVTLPPLAPTVTLIHAVPSPLVIVHPFGTVQV